MKNFKSVLRKNLLAILVIEALFVAMIGLVYARYSSRVDKNISFTAQDGVCFLHEYISDEDYTSKNVKGLSPKWISVADRSLLPFSVSNGKSFGNFYDGETFFKLRVTATDGFDAQKATIKIYVLNGSLDVEQAECYEGVMSPISVDSAYYQTVGVGYLYRFYNDKHEELSIDFPKGGFEYKNLMLEISGVSDSQTSLIRLTVSSGIK